MDFLKKLNNNTLLVENYEKGLSDEHFEVAYNQVYKTPFEDKQSIKKWVEDVIEAGTYSKSKYSLELLVIRTQIQIHGKMPTGYTFNEINTWFGSPYNKLKSFILRQGHYDKDDLYDPIKVVDKVKSQSNERLNKSSGKASTFNKATKAVESLYKQYKDFLPEEDFSSKKASIVDDVMHGVSTHEAFQKAFPEIRKMRHEYNVKRKHQLEKSKLNNQKNRKMKIINQLVDDYLKKSSNLFSSDQKNKAINKLNKIDNVTVRDVQQMFQNIK